ncbi:DNA repair protein XRCC2 homolog isoform X5 [Vigna radiata var. radiata]|uniref:DNA repair protein XRCC2 homolog isoform X5 n=1 Tax=Vigna radiata var. radiata TaxID=3916 RepID=A0A3Q0EP16_VIGRR|nr:DNA repair protein XRCC2 homolog isoform X5 [Vigna radiata var. radiata]
MKEKEREEIEKWIEGDESGTEMLSRVSSVRPFLFPPPLHRVPLRVGNVLELVGPSPSAKTQILINAAITSVLPKPYGGLDHLVLFLDLDCRFDITRFSQLLIHRITQHGTDSYDQALYHLCMARFLYVRCYDSFEFLHTLRTLHRRLEKEKEVQGVGVHVLMIDSIGAFHWMDRASMFLSQRETSKKKLFLQTVSEAVVQNIRKLLQVHPMLIMATKSVIFGNRYSTASNEVKGNMEERCSKNMTRNHQNFQYREYMPSVWQSFVTHRILVHSSDEHPGTINHQNSSAYLLEWLLPKLSFPDRIVVKDLVGWCLCPIIMYLLRRDVYLMIILAVAAKGN